MEEPCEDIVKGFLSMMTGLTHKQLSSIGYTLTGEDELNIHDAANKLESRSFNIGFIDRKASMQDIKNQCKAFVKKNEGKKCVCILDNLGLIEDPFFKGTTTEKDDHIANRILEIKQETGMLIIPVHHLKKEQISKHNLVEGYRPREEYIRGSTRIIDYSNKVLVVNYTDK